MNILIFTAILSAAGIAALIFRGMFLARMMPKEELEKKINESKSVFYDINAKIFVPTAVFLHDSLSPKIYKEFEIIISKFRINVLRTERLLLQLANYIRGKREVKINGGKHPYWNQVGGAEPENKNKDTPE